MTRNKTTTEAFIGKAMIIHGDRYNYAKAVYLRSKSEVEIICLEHGVFKQTPANHLRGQGCPKCAQSRHSTFMSSNINDFIEKAKSIHKEKYDYSEALYIKASEKIKIICQEHGIFYQTPSNHLRGQGCPKCAQLRIGKSKASNLSEFIEKANVKHKSKYDYSEVVYNGASKKIRIICREHGVFEQVVSNHLTGHGCPKCAKLRHAESETSNLSEFIEKAKSIHKCKYDYSAAVYSMSNKKIKIICQEHGVFCQTPSNHLTGNGCPKCGYEKIKEANSLNAPGWGVNGWKKAARNSNNFDGFKLYLVLCGDDKTGEYFLKLGRTFLKVKDRFRAFPYKWKEVYTFSSDAKTVYDAENELKQKYKDLKSVPSTRFGGMEECFTITALDSLMTEFEKLNGQSHELL